MSRGNRRTHVGQSLLCSLAAEKVQLTTRALCVTVAMLPDSLFSLSLSSIVELHCHSSVSQSPLPLSFLLTGKKCRRGARVSKVSTQLRNIFSWHNLILFRTFGLTDGCGCSSGCAQGWERAWHGSLQHWDLKTKPNNCRGKLNKIKDGYFLVSLAYMCQRLFSGQSNVNEK